MTVSPHVVVVGAGTLGLSTAVDLIERGARVTVLEANATASGSSGRSVGVVGTQFTEPLDILLRVHALRHFREWEKLGLVFHHIGYLRLGRTPEHAALFEKSVAMQAEAGFRSHLLAPADITDLVPHMSTAGLTAGLFGPDDGFLDPHGFCTFLADLVRARGGTLRQTTPLLGATRVAGGWRLDTGRGPIDCDVVVNAAGAWATRVASLFGQTLHVRPERHEALQIRLDDPLPYTMPMVMDLVNGEGTGLNVRHDGPGALVAEIHRVYSTAPEDPDRYDDQCSETSRLDLAELLVERFPDLPGARLGRGWAGLYPVVSDHRPLVGLVDPAEPSVVTAAGAGGYGIQLAPVIGQIAADWAVRGAPVSAPGTEVLAPTPDRNRPA